MMQIIETCSVGIPAHDERSESILVQLQTILRGQECPRYVKYGYNSQNKKRRV
jgi:hypothetical protein